MRVVQSILLSGYLFICSGLTSYLGASHGAYGQVKPSAEGGTALPYLIVHG